MEQLYPAFHVQPSTIDAINREIERQEALKASGKFERTCAEMNDLDNLVIVTEELSEVAEDIAAGNREHARLEMLETITCLIRAYERDLTEEFSPQLDPEKASAVLGDLIALGRKARAAQEPDGVYFHAEIQR